jgi:segregation and condensation protein B
MYGTTKEFLDYFNLKNLDELPPLAELRDLNTIGAELELNLPEVMPDEALVPANDAVQVSSAEIEESVAAAEKPEGEETSAILH